MSELDQPQPTEPETELAAPLAGWTWRPMGWGDGAGSVYAPALTTHRGQLWTLFVKNLDAKLYYAHGGTAGQWPSPKKFAGGIDSRVGPALADSQGTLNAMIVNAHPNMNGLFHYRYNDQNDTWGDFIAYPYLPGHPPALASYHGRLFCAFTYKNGPAPHFPGNTLLYTVFTPPGHWSFPPKTCNNERSGAQPALFVADDRLYLLFTADNANKDVLWLVYDEANDTWSRKNPSPGEAAESGVSAASMPGRSFMAFRKRGASNLLVSTYTGGRWTGNESVGQSAWNTPGIVVQDGLLNCLYSSTAQDLGQLWLAQRPDYATVGMDKWMASITNYVPLSQLSIPGTHDTCAVSYVPMVGCQDMSVTAQLNAGIRFLDLRCGLHDGEVYMYHGDYLLDPPFGLKLMDVMSEVYRWMDQPAHTKEAVIVSIKEDHGTDASFAFLVHHVINHGPSSRWLLGDSTPTLGTARNKVVLMRRYPASGNDAIGIDLTHWPDNSPSFNIDTPGGVHLTVQDMYAPKGLDLSALVNNKWSVVLPMLERAVADPSERWYLNFSSAVGTGSDGSFLMEPGDIAYGVWVFGHYTPGVNYYMSNTLRNPPDRRYGMVIMDFPERPTPSDLIYSIVMSNDFMT